MAGKGDKWRKGHSFSGFQSGYDSINWNQKKQTSSKWLNSEEFAHIEILEAKGWDKENWQYSFFKQKITKQEFELRLIKSIIREKKS